MNPKIIDGITALLSNSDSEFRSQGWILLESLADENPQVIPSIFGCGWEQECILPTSKEPAVTWIYPFDGMRIFIKRRGRRLLFADAVMESWLDGLSMDIRAQLSVFYLDWKLRNGHDLSHISQLTLPCGELSMLPDEIGNMRSLQSIVVSENHFTEIPPCVWQLSNLHNLDMSGNRLNNISSQIGALSQLKRMTLEGSFSTIPADLYRLVHLESLSLSSGLRKLPNGISSLRRLRELNLQGNLWLSKLPEDLGLLSALDSLNLEGTTSLKKLPLGLKTLQLDSADYHRLRAEICKQEGLQCLIVKGASPKNIVDTLSYLPSLRKLCMDHDCEEDRFTKEDVHRKYPKLNVVIGASQRYVMIKNI